MKKSNTQKLNWVVTKENKLIGQMAKFELSELRLIAYCLAHFDSKNADNRTIEASVLDLQELFCMDKKSAYSVVRQAVRAVNRKPLEIETERTEEEWYIFTGFRYYKHEGRFEFKISPEAQPLLLELNKGNFTRYRLRDVYQFKKASTWKLYEILKRWLNKRFWYVELDELRFLLGVAGKYSRFGNLELRIIKPGIEEINKLSDIKISYKKRKKGRVVIGVSFTINPNTETEQNTVDVETETERLKYALIETGVHKKTAETYSILAKKTGKTQDVLRQLPGIVERAKIKSSKIPFLKYLLGTIQNIINQDTFFEDEKEKEKQQQDTFNWLKTLPDEGLQSLAEGGNVFAKAVLEERQQTFSYPEGQKNE